MIQLEPGDPGSPKRYSNLLPVVELLLAHGNRYAEGYEEGFALDPRGGGYICELALPIDFDLLEREVVLPPTITAKRKYDSVLDRSTWCMISGPGERASRIVKRPPID